MEANNTKAVREALKEIHDRVNSLDEECGVDPIDIRDIARAALREPPRNCDVGTVEEQLLRFDKEVCHKHFLECGKDDRCDKCFARWAQMPCESGVAK